LNYNAPDSKCYDNIEANCATYGRLYNWATAMGIDAKYNMEEWGGSDLKHKGICPTGWHIPSNADWGVLITTVGSETAGRYLKATSGWRDYEGKSGNGTDDFGFSALPGGYGYSDGVFSYAGDNGDWWSSSEYDSNYAYYRYMYYYNENADWDYGDKSGLFSVRCLQGLSEATHSVAMGVAKKNLRHGGADTCQTLCSQGFGEANENRKKHRRSI